MVKWGIIYNSPSEYFTNLLHGITDLIQTIQLIQNGFTVDFKIESSINSGDRVVSSKIKKT